MGVYDWYNLSWNGSAIKVPGAPVVPHCAYPNANWIGSSTIPGVLPSLTWLKAACPSMYVYPYDDKSSTFTCPWNSGQFGVNYTVEFCPNNKLVPA